VELAPSAEQVRSRSPLQYASFGVQRLALQKAPNASSAQCSVAVQESDRLEPVPLARHRWTFPSLVQNSSPDSHTTGWHSPAKHAWSALQAASATKADPFAVHSAGFPSTQSLSAGTHTRAIHVAASGSQYSELLH
jgi:hypothetical protein